MKKCKCCQGTGKHLGSIECEECYGTGQEITRFENYIAVTPEGIYSTGLISFEAAERLKAIAERLWQSVPVDPKWAEVTA